MSRNPMPLKYILRHSRFTPSPISFGSLSEVNKFAATIDANAIGVYLYSCRSYGYEWSDIQGIASRFTSIHILIMQRRTLLDLWLSTVHDSPLAQAATNHRKSRFRGGLIPTKAFPETRFVSFFPFSLNISPVFLTSHG